MVENTFGGKHSDEKVDIVFAYLQAYTTALKKQGFTLIYIDPFAGTGARTQTEGAMPLFDIDGDKITMPGSAAMALSVEPGFDVVVLIDAKPSHVTALGELKAAHPGRHIEVRNMDANQALKAIVEHYDWRGSQTSGFGSRAVVFLDPFGMQVEWSTLEAIKSTHAIDLWYLFPTQGVLRNAPLDPRKLDPDKEQALTRVFGNRERWMRILYPPLQAQADLFGLARQENGRSTVRAADVEAAVRQELAELFSPGYVCEKPHQVNMRIGGSEVHAYSLFFAVANPDPKACALAARIAKAVLNPRNGRRSASGPTSGRGKSGQPPSCSDHPTA